MKCRLLIDRKKKNPDYSHIEANKARQNMRHYSVPMYVKIPAGTIIENADAHILVKTGVAEPADEECAAECSHITPEARKSALEYQLLLESGQATGDPKYDASPQKADSEQQNTSLQNSDNSGAEGDSAVSDGSGKTTAQRINDRRRGQANG